MVDYFLFNVSEVHGVLQVGVVVCGECYKLEENVVFGDLKECVFF